MSGAVGAIAGHRSRRAFVGFSIALATGALACAGGGTRTLGVGLRNRSLELDVEVTDSPYMYRTRTTFRYDVDVTGDVYFVVPGVNDLSRLHVRLDGRPVDPETLYRAPHPTYEGEEVVRIPEDAGADRTGSHELVVTTPWLSTPEAYFARWGSWHPYLGDRADPVPIELVVEAPTALAIVASGRRTGETIEGEVRRSRWRSRNPQGWMFLAVGPYVDVTLSEGEIPFQVWLPQDDEAFAAVDPEVFVIEPFRVLRFLAGKLGPSGIDTVRLVFFPEPSLRNFSIDGLVAGSAATAARVSNSPEFLRGFLAHELAHYWFGDLVRGKGPGARWLSEGFAEYWRYRYEEAVGADPLPWSYRNQLLLTIFRSGEMPTLLEPATGEAEALYYQKGAYVLYILERCLGRDRLDAAMHAFVNEHRGRMVEPWAFFETVAEIADTNLDWFVRQWLERPRGPVLADPVVHFTGDSGRVRVTVEVSQALPTYRVDLPIVIRTADGEEHVFTRRVDSLNERFTFDLTESPVSVTLDPESTILKWFPGERLPIDFASFRAELLAGSPYRIVGAEVSRRWDPVREWMTEQFGVPESATAPTARHLVLLGGRAARTRARLAPDLPEPAEGTVQVFVRRDPEDAGRAVLGIEGDIPDVLPPLIPEAPLSFIVFRDGNVIGAHATGLPELTWSRANPEGGE